MSLIRGIQGICFQLRENKVSLLFLCLYNLENQLLMSSLFLATSDELLRYHPEFFEEGWSPPSQYASIHEQRVKRGIRVSSSDNPAAYQQKKIVLLVNEGTASSAEVFASSLRDNGRLVALVGAKTYGKGLIQVSSAFASY